MLRDVANGAKLLALADEQGRHGSPRLLDDLPLPGCAGVAIGGAHLALDGDECVELAGKDGPGRGLQQRLHGHTRYGSVRASTANGSAARGSPEASRVVHHSPTKA